MKIARFIFNLFGVNTYVMWDPVSLEAAIVDPGMTDDAEREAIDRFITDKSLRVTLLLDTHMHIDHIAGNTYVRDRYGVEIRAGKADEFLSLSLPEQSSQFHFPSRPEAHGVGVELKDGDTLYLGKEPIDVITVPGHSPGSVAFYCPESGFVITGDALFNGSIGRTDLPGGDMRTLITSVRSRLLTLPPDTMVLPGHGDETTIGREKASNIFLR